MENKEQEVYQETLVPLDQLEDLVFPDPEDTGVSKDSTELRESLVNKEKGEQTDLQVPLEAPEFRDLADHLEKGDPTANKEPLANEEQTETQDQPEELDL